MKRFLLIIAIFCFIGEPAFADTTGQASPISTAEITRNHDLAIVKIASVSSSGGLATGSGFVINMHGYILTNHHVIDGAASIHILHNQSSYMADTFLTHAPRAELIWADQGLDIAILRSSEYVELHPQGSVSPLRLTASEPAVGSTVIAVGYPSAGSERTSTTGSITASFTTTTGEFSRTTAGRWQQRGVDLQLVEHTAEISWGNSGGPLFDQCGRVIGINTQHSISELPGSSPRNPQYVRVSLFYASQITETIRELQQRNIQFYSSTSECLSFEEMFSAGQEQFKMTLLGLVGVFAAVTLSFSLLLVVALRRPREAVVQFVERSVRRQSAAHPGEAPNQGPRKSASASALILDGFSSNPKSYRLVLQANHLQNGKASIGRNPESANYIIDDERVSRLHATMSVGDGQISIRDENSTNGTFIGGRRCEPGELIRVRDGESVSFGGVEFKLII